VIDNNFGFVAPDIVEQIHHNPDGLVPHQFIISLVVAFSLDRKKGAELGPRTEV
jgi:hypothetical protein